MPLAPPRICMHPGCNALVHTVYCDQHKPQQFKREERQSSSARGYGSRWQKARVTWLRRYPLCVECDRRGEVVEAVAVDHIVPHRGDQKLFWDTKNWQSLCLKCHAVKTATEDGGFGNKGGSVVVERGCDINGFPI